MRDSLKQVWMLFFASALFLLAFSAQADAATYYADNELASDCIEGNYSVANRDCSGSDGSAYDTLGEVQTAIQAGDTVLVRGGAYPMSHSVSLNKANTTFRAYLGETPIIDCNYQWPLGAGYEGVINLNADHVTIDGFDIRRSKSMGITVYASAPNAAIKNCTISDSFDAGILINGNSNEDRVQNTLIDGCDVARSQRRLYFRDHPDERPDPEWDYDGPYGASIVTARAENFIIRNTKSHHSYFENVDIILHSEGGLIENCEIYGSGQMQVYLSGIRNTVRNNLIYGTDDLGYHNTLGHGFACIWSGGEDWDKSLPPQDINQKVYGNFLANCGLNYWFSGQADTATRYNYVYNNVLSSAYFIQDVLQGAGVAVSSGTTNLGEPANGSVFKNNVIYQPSFSEDYNVQTQRATFSYNLWDRTPSANSQGTNSYFETFSLAKDSGWNDIISEGIEKSDFVLDDNAKSLSRGAWLTTVSSNVSDGTSVPVAEAEYFFGDEDLIFSNGAAATIQSIDRQNNILTVSPAISVSSGTGLALHDFFDTDSPNIGPWSFGTATVSPSAPSGLVVR